MNARLLANDPPGWGARELVDELVARPARVVGFDFPFSVPYALLRPRSLRTSATHGAFIGWRCSTGGSRSASAHRDPLDSGHSSHRGETAPRVHGAGRSVTDLAARGQPPLKDELQATFQMILRERAARSCRSARAACCHSPAEAALARSLGVSLQARRCWNE